MVAHVQKYVGVKGKLSIYPVFKLAHKR